LSIFRFTFQLFVTKRQTSRLKPNFPHKNFAFNMQEVISMVKKSTWIDIMKYVLKDSLNCVANKKHKSVVGKLMQPPKWKNSKTALILN